MADAIYNTARQLLTLSDPPKKVTLMAIMREVPHVTRVKRRPENYPRAAQALQEVLETSEAFNLRRIKDALQKYREERICPGKWEFILRTHLRTYILRSETIQQSLNEAMIVLSQFA